jgi:signal transduction histidine kinase
MAAMATVGGAAVFLGRRYVDSSVRGAELTRSLQAVLALNRELSSDIQEQINMLHRQFEQPSPFFPYRFAQLNYALGEKQTRYLRLNIGAEERLTVESIRALQGELGVQSLLVFDELRLGNREQAVQYVSRIEDLRERIDKEFDALNRLQILRLQAALDASLSGVKQQHLVLVGLTATLAVALGWANWMLYRRVLRPARRGVAIATAALSGSDAARPEPTALHETEQLLAAVEALADSLARRQAELARLTERSARRVEDLQTELLRTQARAAAGSLVRGVAHELNNPLTAISGFAEAQKVKIESTRRDDDEIRVMTDILAQTERCRRIVANLADFAFDGETQAGSIPVNTAIERVLQLREYELKRKNIRLLRGYDPADPRVQAELRQVQQAVLYLINWAQEAVQTSGRPGWIRVSTSSGAGEVEVDVVAGDVAMTESPRPFGASEIQSDAASDTERGLYLCRVIVEGLRGRIQAMPTDVGACVRFSLPVGAGVGNESQEQQVFRA